MKSFSIRRLVAGAAAFVCVCQGAVCLARQTLSPEPTQAALQAAEGIRREALLPPQGPAGRPLPLASHWNVGSVRGTFEPAHQIGLLQQGSHILPWMATPAGDPARDSFLEYWQPLLGYCAGLRLPISMRGTQWEAMLLDQQYREGPEQRWAGVIQLDGTRTRRLSPFGAVDVWADPAEAWVNTEAMRWAQQQYPDPPLVLWVGNNEAPDLRWHQVEQSRRYRDRYGAGRSDEFKRRVVGDGWIERYGVMFAAMRAAMASNAWRQNLRFVGYGAFGPSHLGRWDGWEEYSLYTDQRMAWEWYAWDGGSPSYYTHNWNDNRDHWVHSPQVESMNWMFMLQEAWQANPDYWWEVSTWDGNEVGAWLQGVGASSGAELAEKSSRPLDEQRRAAFDPALVRKSKALQYLQDGQSYPPERALGWVQYGLWLLRPRVLREFRGHATPLEPVREYWLQTVRAVDRVWQNPTLERFWRFGELVPNSAQQHPYQARIPARLQGARRWYLLETDLAPARPWALDTDLPVLSLALVLPGEAEAGGASSPPARQWLVYAHSPLQDRPGVRITLPGFGEIRVDVPRTGTFILVQERDGQWRTLPPAPAANASR